MSPVDRGLLDLDKDSGGTLEELLLEGCNPLSKKDTDHGGVSDGKEIANGTNCRNPADDLVLPNDADHDGFPVPADCDDANPAIHPGAADPPDPDAIDANCDGFDGSPTAGIFVTPTGDDASPGTRAQPKATVQAAIDAAFAANKDVFLDSAIFDDDNPGGVVLRDGVNLYGGYRAADNWDRRSIIGATRIEGAPQAATATAVTAELQLIELRGHADTSKTAYGLRALGGSNITLRRARVRALDGVAGERGADGAHGAVGRAGQTGGTGDEDGSNGAGGAAGVGAGSNGGAGGDGGAEGDHSGLNGQNGQGPAGGTGGSSGASNGCDNADIGLPGAAGGAGGTGAGGAGATNGLAGAASVWTAAAAGDGLDGSAGSGGGGGGGGGGQGGTFCDNGGGAGGGGGGGGGAKGLHGTRGTSGGGSFAIYLFNSAVHVLDGSFAIAGSGANGGAGGQGGTGGAAGVGGSGGVTVDGGLFQDVDGETGVGGAGGNGGAGGSGGAGGGGAGGPSAAIGRFGTSTETHNASTLTHATGGTGGSSPAGGGSNGASGLAADVLP